MQVNTTVVTALMQLRGIDAGTLAKLVHVPRNDLWRWLTDESAEELLPYESQLELLSVLGVREGNPRGDVVHYWAIHEPLFSSPTQTYWALQVVLKAFGPAQAIFVAQDTDPVFSFKAKAHFTLRFMNFMAMLEVTANPLKSISFDPDLMTDLSWAPDAMGVLLPEQEYARLEPGSLKVKGLHQYISYTAESSQWEKLKEVAIAQGLSVERVASLLLGDSGTARLSNVPPTPSAAIPSSAPVAPIAQPRAEDPTEIFRRPVAGV